MNKTRVALYGIGLDTYWSQFDGLFDKLLGFQTSIADRIRREHPEVEVMDTGIVDSPVRAHELGSLIARSEVDMILLYISTYALSSTVLPVVQKAKVPVIVLNLQPTKAVDYDALNKIGDRAKMTGVFLMNCQACAAPEIACVFNRARIPYHMVTGTLDDAEAWGEISEWLEAACVARALRDARIGLVGHYYCGMLDVYSDMTQLSAVFGAHFEIREMCELVRYRKEATEEEISAKVEQFQREFAVDSACDPDEIKRAARTSVALDKLVQNNSLGALAYYYEGQPGNEHQDAVTSVIAGNTLLTMNGVPVAGEYEIKNVIAMKIMDLLGRGGSFSEFYALDFADDIVLLGHDGPGHGAIAEGPVGLVPLGVYHGKPGKGLSIQMSVKNGPVTLLSIVQNADGQVKLLIAEGESVPGPIIDIGNTNSRYRFSIGAKGFMNAWTEQGPAHHMAIGSGHFAGTLRRLGKLLGIETVQVC